MAGLTAFWKPGLGFMDFGAGRLVILHGPFCSADVVRAADTAVKAVRRIGGAHPLTEAEQRVVFDEIHYHQSRSLFDAIVAKSRFQDIRQ